MTTIRDLIDRLFGPRVASASSARSRLKMVLAHDRSDLSPAMLEQMRFEIMQVVSKYLELDDTASELSLETEERATALIANLPIRRVKQQGFP